MAMFVEQAGASPLGGLFLLFLMWVLGKVLEAVWSSITNNMGNKTEKEKVADVLTKKGGSALSEEANAILKDVEQGVKQLLKKGLRRFM